MSLILLVFSASMRSAATASKKKCKVLYKQDTPKPTLHPRPTPRPTPRPSRDYSHYYYSSGSSWNDEEIPVDHFNDDYRAKYFPKYARSDCRHSFEGTRTLMMPYILASSIILGVCLCSALVAFRLDRAVSRRIEKATELTATTNEAEYTEAVEE